MVSVWYMLLWYTIYIWIWVCNLHVQCTMNHVAERKSFNGRRPTDFNCSIFNCFLKNIPWVNIPWVPVVYSDFALRLSPCDTGTNFQSKFSAKNVLARPKLSRREYYLWDSARSCTRWAKGHCGFHSWRSETNIWLTQLLPLPVRWTPELSVFCFVRQNVTTTNFSLVEPPYPRWHDLCLPLPHVRFLRPKTRS